MEPTAVQLAYRKAISDVTDSTGKVVKNNDEITEVYHIVAYEGELAKESRKILNKYNVELNSASNGVLLPNKVSDKVTTETMCGGGHSEEYYKYVNDELKKAADDIEVKGLSGDEATKRVEESLDDIREELLEGTAKGASKSGLTQVKINEILAIPKGSRPDPSTYLSKEYIEKHLEMFDDGVSIIQTNVAYNKYTLKTAI